MRPRPVGTYKRRVGLPQGLPLTWQGQHCKCRKHGEQSCVAPHPARSQAAMGPRPRQQTTF